MFLPLLAVLWAQQTHANSAPVVEISDQVVVVGENLDLVVAPVDPEGVTPNLYLSDSPPDASFNDNGDGTRTFSWQPNKKGVYGVSVVAQDAQDASLRTQAHSRIAVLDSDDLERLKISADEVDALSFNDLISLLDLVTEDGYLKNISTGKNAGDVEKILTDLPVSVSQTNVQQTSVDVMDGYVYTVNIEPGPSGDQRGIDLLTVVRQGRQLPNGSWHWESSVVEDRTLYNKWHTAPSVAVDKDGALHIAYNMHNFPWQYKQSTQPHDIYSLAFRGQEISDEELKRAAEQNRTSFPTLGTADIPGNQITYPAFFKDKNDDLYISYRFAAKPNRAFNDRTMSSGIAVFNGVSKTWAPIGGSVSLSDGDFARHADAPDQAVAFASQQGWTSYLPKLGFDSQNNMLVSSMWRHGTAGDILSRPCVVKSNDRVNATDMSGRDLGLPVNPEACGNVGFGNDEGFYSIGAFAVSRDDVPYVLLSPTNGSRQILRYSAADNRWLREKSPESATEIFFDSNNNLYAVANGIKIYKKSNPEAGWELIYDEGSKRNCYPYAKLDEHSGTALIHSHSCDGKTVTIYALRLK